MDAVGLPGRQDDQDYPARAQGGEEIFAQGHSQREAVQQGGEEEQFLHKQRAAFHLARRGGHHGEGTKQDHLQCQRGGDYNIGISDGKASTSFGVEALSESSQNRKDFREAVLKAVQTYNEETSKEVVTETDASSEYTESGTLVNPNDELAVTYLFYELQKRYRLSEQIYRVAPVVLVAQEVPSPDQITEAWVISNDWILNRCLLD